MYCDSEMKCDVCSHVAGSLPGETACNIWMEETDCFFLHVIKDKK